MEYLTKIWNRLFLEERPSISLSFFRIAVAVTVGSVVIPTLLNLKDNYFSTAFKTYNLSFFTPGAVELVQQSSDGFVLFVVVLFYVFWFFFLIGLFSQISCILMTLCCYYFYALNAYHVGTLSWDILLVTMFLMCLTPYHGDYFSADCLRRRDADAYKRRRPFYLQRLLQMQVAFTFFYTGLYKITAQGNWLTDNPIYYLMNYPPPGVVKYFLIRDFMADKPQLCYVIGVTIVVIELLMPLLLFWRKTRLSAIYLGFIFHLMLILTLDVPATFFLLFPPQLLLFFHPDKVLEWIESKRKYNEEARAGPDGTGGQSRLIYDGNCRFCRASTHKLEVMDLFKTLKMVDFQSIEDVKSLHPDLTKEKVMHQMYLIEPNGRLYGGFHAFRRISLTTPMLYPMILLFYFPGSGLLGPPIYRWVAKNRYLFHFGKSCKNNACYQ